ncbi:hypothetical protein ACTXT7_006686 [Hymenolepis weldensis]
MSPDQFGGGRQATPNLLGRKQNKFLMDLNSPIIDSEENTVFDVPKSNKIKLFDVFDDPPLISDDEEGPLKIDIPNSGVDEDDESLGYDSIFKSGMEYIEKIESNAAENRTLLDDRDDYEMTLAAEEKVIVTKEMEQDDSPVNDKDELSEGDEQAPVDLDLTVNDNDKDSEGPVKKVYDVSSDSSVDEESVDENHHPEVSFNDEEVEVPTYNESFGRWTCSGGAAKKTKSTTSSGSKKPSTVYEKEKFAVHSESQRLIRETNLELLHYKPKEYTSVAEFKKALHGDKTEPLSSLRPPGTQAVKATSSLNGAQASTSHPLRNFNLPNNLPPPKPLQANNDIIDLLQDDQPVILGRRSQAEELISRFNKFAKPTNPKDSDPITKTQEFSILTKEVDGETGTVSLKLDSVKYKSTTKQPLTFTNRREWAKYRAELKEIMREKKLKQYEERMKEYKPSQYSEMSGDRDEDEDWVEDDEESFSSDCSTLESEEEDDEAPHVKRKSKNPFLDDEAAEDDDDAEGGSRVGDENDSDVTVDDVDKFIAEGRPTIRPIHNGHLEPGDVDLFASDSITQSVPSQNRTLSDRSWNATPYSLLFSQKQPSGSTTDSSSLEQTKIESTLQATTQTQVLKTQDPTQRMTALDDYSVVKVELNLTQFDSAGSKGLTEGPTQTQLIDDFEDIDPTQPITMPLPSVDELDKPKLVRIRDVATASTVKDSDIIHPSAQSTQLVPSNIVDLDFTQNVDFGETQTQALELTVPLSKDKLAAEEITRPKLTRVRDALNAPVTNEAESLPDIRELPSEEHDLREVSNPTMDLLDPSYIQCSFATQAVDEPQESNPIEESHKFRKRLRHNSGDDSDGNEEASLHPKRRATIEQSAQPLEEIETIEGEIERASSGSVSVMEVEENAEEDMKDAETNNVEEEGDDDGERFGEVDSEEEEEEGDENEAEEEYSSGDDEEKEYLKMIQSQIEDKKLEKKHPKFRPAEFIDEEAELSGDEEERAIYEDERDEDLDDEDDAASLKDFVDENEFDDRKGKLRREVERVYNRIQEDDDQRKLRYLKEMFFEDGDLYDEEGRARRRRFKWKGLDDEDPFPLGDKRLDFGAEEGDEEESGISSSGIAGFMSRGLLQGVVAEEVPSADNPDGIPKDGSSQATENASEDTSTADDAQNTLDYSESLLSALGKKVIFRQQSVSLTFKSPKKRSVIDVRQKTLPGMLLRSSSTNDVPLLEKPTLLSKHGSLLSRPAPVLPVPASSRSLIPLSRQFSTDMDMDNDIENDPGVTNRGQVDTSAFGLRTKVGLSCFSMRTNSDVTPITNRSHFIKPVTAQPMKAVSNPGSTLQLCPTRSNSLLNGAQSSTSNKLTSKTKQVMEIGRNAVTVL